MLWSCVAGGLQFGPVSSEWYPLLHGECLWRFSLCSLFVLVFLTLVFVAPQVEEVEECKLSKDKSDEELILFIIDTKDLRWVQSSDEEEHTSVLLVWAVALLETQTVILHSLLQHWLNKAWHFIWHTLWMWLWLIVVTDYYCDCEYECDWLSWV